MDYLITDGPGRAAFVRYWRLLALAVADHPSAVACEFMNEPMTIRRPLAFDTWRAAGEAVNAVIPDMAVSVMDTGEGVLLPSWLVNVTGGGGFISTDTLQWIKTARTVYYAWHWYGLPATPTEAVADAEALGESWGVPTIVRFFVITRANPVPPSSHPLPPPSSTKATEYGDCVADKTFAAANVSRLYWHCKFRREPRAPLRYLYPSTPPKPYQNRLGVLHHGAFFWEPLRAKQHLWGVHSRVGIGVHRRTVRSLKRRRQTNYYYYLCLSLS